MKKERLGFIILMAFAILSLGVHIYQWVMFNPLNSYQDEAYFEVYSAINSFFNIVAVILILSNNLKSKTFWVASVAVIILVPLRYVLNQIYMTQNMSQDALSSTIFITHIILNLIPVIYYLIFFKRISIIGKFSTITYVLLSVLMSVLLITVRISGWNMTGFDSYHISFILKLVILLSLIPVTVFNFDYTVE